MVRSILNMDNETFLSLYELSDKIDLGCLIEEYKIPLSMKETVSDIDKKLQQGIPSLLTSLNLYLEGKIHGQIISDGIYYPKIENQPTRVSGINPGQNLVSGIVDMVRVVDANGMGEDSVAYEVSGGQTAGVKKDDGTATAETNPNYKIAKITPVLVGDRSNHG